jgi:hypothetical protein
MCFVYLEDKVLIFQDQMNVPKHSSDLTKDYRMYESCCRVLANSVKFCKYPVPGSSAV